jgi:hypothetical protein
MTTRDALVAEYLFDANAEDSSGSGHHGVVHGAMLTADRFGKPKHAYAFDGVDDYIEVSPPPKFSSEAMSLSAWARYEPRDFSGYTNCIIAQDDGNDDDQSRRVFQLSTESGHVIWHRMIGARDPICKTRVQPGTWHHVVAVHDHGVNRLYVDGILHDTVEHRLWTHDSQPLHIGRKGTPEPYFFFKGAIDDIRIYDRALDESEVRELLEEDGWKAKAVGIPVVGDPLTGRWGQDGVVFLHLRYDGDKTVTGRIMNGRPETMSPIVKGTFDRATAHLRLEGRAVDPRHGPANWLIEGMLDQEEITVCATFGGFTGNFMLTSRGSRLRATRKSIRSQLGAMAFDLFKPFASSAAK